MRILVTIPDDWVPVLDEKRGIATRTAWIRHQLEPALFKKEAVAPLVPDADAMPQVLVSANTFKPPSIDLMVAVRDEIERRKAAITPNEFDAQKAKPKARRKKSVKDSLTTSGEASTSRKAQRSRQRANTPASVARSKSESPSLLPARCNRGACTGTINPVSGRCFRCNQTPLKESK